MFKLKSISAKNLASLAMPDFCPRCFWIRARMGFKSPWSIFPSIFSSIDMFSKDITGVHIKTQNKPPQWLMEMGKLTTRIEVPHWSKFAFQDPESGVILRGSPDEMFNVKGGTLAILDYKTSRFNNKKDLLAPLYKTQLGGYRWIALKLGLGETSLTGLIYYDPQTRATVKNILKNGFSMHFDSIIHEVKTDLDEVRHYLMEAKRIAEMPTSPKRLDDCKNCKLVDELNEISIEPLPIERDQVRDEQAVAVPENV